MKTTRDFSHVEVDLGEGGRCKSTENSALQEPWGLDDERELINGT